jgi:hypothetical protein
MRHSFVILLLLSCVTLPLSAQSPEGWKMRVDRSQSAQDPDDRPDLTLVSKGKALHVKGGPAGTFWDARNNSAGSYTLRRPLISTNPVVTRTITAWSSAPHNSKRPIRHTRTSWSHKMARISFGIEWGTM